MKQFISTFLILLIACSYARAQDQDQKPNIVFILADDFGYTSLNSYGADSELVRTPHIDRLAERGMRFTQANTPASICTPTRYGFLTGRYPSNCTVGLFTHRNFIWKNFHSFIIGKFSHKFSFLSRVCIIHPGIMVIFYKVAAKLPMVFNIIWHAVHPVPVPARQISSFTQVVVINNISCVDKELRIEIK